MATESRYNINVTTTGAESAAAKLGTIEKGIGGLARAAAGLAAGYFSASGLIHALKFSVEQAVEAEAAEKRLAVAYGKSTTALVSFATAQMRRTRFDDDAIVAAEASIAAFTKEEGRIKALTLAALDLAEAKGIDLTTAADMVGKAFGGSAGMLQRYGAQVSGAAGTSERLASVTSEVARLWGGQAAAAAETLSGKLDQAKNAVGNAAQALGDTLAPVVKDVAEWVQSAAEGFERLFGAAGGENAGLYKQMDDVRAAKADIEALYRVGDAGSIQLQKQVEAAYNGSTLAAQALSKMAFGYAALGYTDLADKVRTYVALLETELPAVEKAAKAKEVAGDAGAAGLTKEQLKAIEEARKKAEWWAEWTIKWAQDDADLRKEMKQADMDWALQVATDMGEVEEARERLRKGDKEWAEEVATKMQEADEAIKRSASVRRQAAAQFIGNLAQINQGLKGSTMLTLRLAQAEGTVRAIDAGVSTAAYMADIVPFPIPMILGAAMTAAQLAQVARMGEVGFASGGWVDGPGGGRSDAVPARLSAGERVLSVREIALMGGRGAVDALARGGVGGGITVNFSGPVTDRAYVQDFIIPEIKRAVRLSA